ncbi:MAG: flagellar hook-length control protein FliK [Deltaproteobacteria bacterium]
MNISIFDMSASRAEQNASFNEASAKDMRSDDADFTKTLDAEMNNPGSETTPSTQGVPVADKTQASDAKEDAPAEQAERDTAPEDETEEAGKSFQASMPLGVNIAALSPLSDGPLDAGDIDIAKSTAFSMQSPAGSVDVLPEAKDEGFEEGLSETEEPVFQQVGLAAALNESSLSDDAAEAALDAALSYAEALQGNGEKTAAGDVPENSDKAGDRENPVKEKPLAIEGFEPASLARDGALGQGTDEGAPESDLSNSDAMGLAADELKESVREAGDSGVQFFKGPDEGPLGLAASLADSSKAGVKAAETASTEARQVFDAIDSAFKSTPSKGLTEVRLRLYPDNLGELNIRLSLEDNLLNATITVDNEGVKGILESGSFALKEVLGRHGIALDNFVVELGRNAALDLNHGSFNDSMQRNMFYNNPDGPGHGFSGNGADDEARMVRAPLYGAAAGISSGVDIFI